MTGDCPRLWRAGSYGFRSHPRSACSHGCVLGDALVDWGGDDGVLDELQGRRRGARVSTVVGLVECQHNVQDAAWAGGRTGGRAVRGPVPSVQGTAAAAATGPWAQHRPRGDTRHGAAGTHERHAIPSTTFHGVTANPSHDPGRSSAHAPARAPRLAGGWWTALPPQPQTQRR